VRISRDGRSTGRRGLPRARTTTSSSRSVPAISWSGSANSSKRASSTRLPTTDYQRSGASPDTGRTASELFSRIVRGASGAAFAVPPLVGREALVPHLHLSRRSAALGYRLAHATLRPGRDPERASTDLHLPSGREPRGTRARDARLGAVRTRPATRLRGRIHQRNAWSHAQEHPPCGAGGATFLRRGARADPLGRGLLSRPVGTGAGRRASSSRSKVGIETASRAFDGVQGRGNPARRGRSARSSSLDDHSGAGSCDRARSPGDPLEAV